MKNIKILGYVIIICILAITIANISLYIKTKNIEQNISKSTSYYSKTYLVKIDSLQKKNVSLNLSVIQYEHKIAQLTNSLDSVKYIKNNNKIRYVKKYKEINDASANDLINQLQGIFAENDIN